MGLGDFALNVLKYSSPTNYVADEFNLGRKIYNASGDLYDHVSGRVDDLTGKTGAEAAKEAANIQAASGDKALALQKELFDKQVELNEPWRLAGVNALGDLATGLKSGSFDAPQEEFKYDMPSNQFEFNFQADPGYNFRQQQQQQAIERSAAAGGGLFAGATLSDLARKSGEMASDEYGRSYARAYGENRDKVSDALQNRNFAYGNFSDAQGRKRLALQDRFSRLSTLAGFGESGASRTGTAASSYGDRASANIMDIGNTQAAGRVGAANSQQAGTMGLANLAAAYFGGK